MTWVFGYGSLVWRPAFPHVRRVPAYVEGWTRRFWQGSTDHRGVPGDPGRVVTLVREPDARTWGVAYEIHPDEIDAVLRQLDVREKGGYARHVTPIRAPDGVPIAEALIYVATADNPNYLGEAPLEAIASQVIRARGPSGPNVEYVLELARALRELGAEDDHVFALAALVASRA
jgi:cation transport regulator ChaC